MKRKLSEKGYSAEEIEKTLNFLIEFHYLNDAAYSADYIRYAVAKGRSVRRIKAELIRDGVTRDTAEKAVADFFLEEGFSEREMERERAYAQALKVMQSSFAEHSFDERLQAKIARKLAAQGFDADTIYPVLNRLKRL